MKRLLIALLASISMRAAAPGDCDLSAYKPQEGLKAESRAGLLEVTWQGERREQLRAVFTIRHRQPLVRELAVRKAGGPWIVLGANLSPEFQVTSGVRRLSQQQIAPLKELGIALTPEVIEREKWNAFLGCPADGSRKEGRKPRPPRKPQDIRKARVKYHAAGCEVSFPSLGS